MIATNLFSGGAISNVALEAIVTIGQARWRVDYSIVISGSQIQSRDEDRASVYRGSWCLANSLHLSKKCRPLDMDFRRTSCLISGTGIDCVVSPESTIATHIVKCNVETSGSNAGYVVYENESGFFNR